MDGRSRALTEAAMRGLLVNDDGKASRKRKAAAQKPWQLLEEEWREAEAAEHGKSILDLPKWGPAERSLARKLFADDDFDTVVKRVRAFIKTWCPSHNKYPSMRLYWTIREQVRSELDGGVKSK